MRVAAPAHPEILPMKIAMLGLGRMGANMVRRLLRAGHDCCVYDPDAAAAAALADEGARAASSVADLVACLSPPRVVWLMIPAHAVESVIETLAPLLAEGDILVDGGNTHYVETVRRARTLAERGIRYVDAGTSGGIWGLQEGYCLMLGGPREAIEILDPILAALAPGGAGIAPTSPQTAGSTLDRGYLHCGPRGAGHYVKMVHNGIEYGMMAAYAEGFNLLRHAGEEGSGTAPTVDVGVAEIAELWRRGSVVRSWLLDLSARALQADPDLVGFEGHVSDSGEGRWTVNAAVDAGVPVPVLSAALFARFSSRGNSEFADKLLSALRNEFGGHREPPASA
jgi:6-phosphogluconate dehydrogenase